MSQYKKLEEKKGKAFARTLRDHDSRLLEIPGIVSIVEHAGDDAEPLIPYLMTQLDAPENELVPIDGPKDPFELLDRAGYDAFYVDTKEKQDSIEKYFAPGEELNIFGTDAYRRYSIVHAVKKNVDQIKREDFVGDEARQDDYGTSVISFYMLDDLLRDNYLISITNRYGNRVSDPDNTFNLNPDNIIPGLSMALNERFDLNIPTPADELPNGYVLIGGRIVQYHTKSYIENWDDPWWGTNDKKVDFYRNSYYVYFGDQVWAADGKVNTVDRAAGNAMFGTFLFNNKTKQLELIEPDNYDSFADDFNRAYGGYFLGLLGDRQLHVDGEGNLRHGDDILIGTRNSQIVSLDLPKLKTMGDECLNHADGLETFNAPRLQAMGDKCLERASDLKTFNAPRLQAMGDKCLGAYGLTTFNAPALKTMGEECLTNTGRLTTFNAPALEKMKKRCLRSASALTTFDAPRLETMGRECLREARALRTFNAPALEEMGFQCLKWAYGLTTFSAPALKTMGEDCLDHTVRLTTFNAPALEKMEKWCLHDARGLTTFDAPKLKTMGTRCLEDAEALTTFNAPALEKMGYWCLNNAPALTTLNAPAIEIMMGSHCLENPEALKILIAPKMDSNDLPDPVVRRLQKHPLEKPFRQGVAHVVGISSTEDQPPSNTKKRERRWFNSLGL